MRNKKLTPERRKEIATKAANERWAGWNEGWVYFVETQDGKHCKVLVLRTLNRRIKTDSGEASANRHQVNRIPW